jgi:threonylcarbamoyladenosine tRNA methylthiotransferase MtaB
MNIEVHTLGCRLNLSETEELIRKLNKEKLLAPDRKSSVIVVRGCSVTERAEKETGQKIKNLRRENKKSIIIAAGCLSENFISAQADFIFLKKHENKLIGKLAKILGSSQKLRTKIKVQKSINLRTRAFVKIQDGCNNFCTYCLVPYLRNKEISLASSKIISQIEERIKEGYQEIVLTGVNIGEWQEKNKNFIWLIKEILNKTNVVRLRISSLWPEQAEGELIKLFKNPRLCRHLHFSLQSLSAKVLRRMNRFYRPDRIIKQVNKIKKALPDMSFSADLIVGFPGETEEEFKETVKKIKELGFFKLHIFRYSPRPGTAAALMKNQVKEDVKKCRSQELLALSDHFNLRWRKEFLGQKRKVLFEQLKNNFWQGLSDNYLKVFVKSTQNIANKIFFIKFLKVYKDGIYGKIISK